VVPWWVSPIIKTFRRQRRRGFAACVEKTTFGVAGKVVKMCSTPPIAHVLLSTNAFNGFGRRGVRHQRSHWHVASL
jgi:hypothetical protein